MNADASSGRQDALLEVRDLVVAFTSRRGVLRAVDGASLRVRRGRTTALVGESGCGKSATALSILRLIPQAVGGPRSGRIIFHDDGAAIDLLALDGEGIRRIRGRRIAMIFQEPMTALNPVYTIGEQIAETMELHRGMKRKEAWAAAGGLLSRVGIADAPRRLKSYPHQLSGGMRQRAMIAQALACRPAVLVADEPTTALDPTIQQQILQLLRDVQEEFGMGVLLITHDLGVVAHAADDVYVMYAGRIVEHGSVTDVIERPLHPYTQGLLRCTPRLSATGGQAASGTRGQAANGSCTGGQAASGTRRLPTIPGTVPDPTDPPSGCRFHPRCTLSAERAAHERVAIPVKSEVGAAVLRRCVEAYDSEPSGVPPLVEHEPGHFAACWEANGTQPSGLPRSAG